MDDLSGNKKKKKGEFNIISAASVVILVCICFILDVKVGIGAIIGALAGYFCWTMLGETAGQEKWKVNRHFWIQQCCSRIFPSRKICRFPMRFWISAGIS